MKSGKPILIISLVAWSTCATFAQAPVSPGPVIQTETRVVLVDAVATDGKGNYVRDLTAKDFKVYEDDREQAITSFSFEGGRKSSTKHYIVLFFDDSNLDINDQPRARQAATRFVEAVAGEDRMIAVVDYNGTLRVTQNFTNDTARLTRAIGTSRPGVFGAGEPDAQAGAEPALTTTNFGTRNSFIALRSLAQNLASVPGRKTLVYLSPGFQIKVSEHGAEFNDALAACNRANVAIYTVDARGLVTDGKGASQAELYPVPVGRSSFLQSENRRRTSFLASFVPRLTPRASDFIFAFQGPSGIGGSMGNGSGNWSDPRNQARLEMPALPSNLTSLDVLFALAAGTGGFIVRNTNDLAGSLTKISEEQDEYYLLGYTPPDSPEESCHKLRVKVERKGVTVRSRSGYCNARRQDQLTNTAVARQLENVVAGQAPPPPGAAIQAPFFYTAPNVARVDLAMNIPLGKLKTEKQKGKLHAEVNILGVAYRRDSSVAARFSDVVRIDFDNEKKLEAFVARPFYYENQFDIAPGEYVLKVAYSTGGDGIGKIEAPLSIEPHEVNQFSLSGLALSKNYIKVTDPRANLEAAWIGGRTPLIALGMRFTPAAAYTFKSNDAVAIYAEIYEPALTNPDAAKQLGVGAGIRIIDRKTGQEKVDTGIMRAPFPETPGNPVMPVASTVPIANLQPGSYRLEFEAGDTAGKVTKRTVDFEIE
jgi:VWFA-related protein